MSVIFFFSPSRRNINSRRGANAPPILPAGSWPRLREDLKGEPSPKGGEYHTLRNILACAIAIVPRPKWGELTEIIRYRRTDDP